MDFSKILENKPLLYGIIGAVVLFLALVVTISIVGASKKPANGTEITGEPLKENVDLLTTDNAGKAIEIQALLAKYDIAVSRRLDGTKSILYLKKGDCKTGRKACYTTDRDLALIQIVQSGLMDQNVGLEIFDKGDFTSTKEDKKKHEQNLQDEQEALKVAKKQVEQLHLPMRMIDANFLFDRKQLLFHFVADDRVDFRELARKLAQIYKTRIELRQIGVRDKAKKIGGLGPCGRFLCCNSFLTEFDSVSINMAKNQYISLNPTKINGVCGRLLCCLKYEDQIYTDLKKELPPMGKTMETPEGKGKIVSVNVFKKEAEVELPNHTTVIVDLTEGKNGTNS